MADARDNYAKLLESFKELEADRNRLNWEIEALRTRNQQLQADLDVPKKPELPDAPDLLNQFKAKRKKSKTDLADVEAILEILEGDEPE